MYAISTDKAPKAIGPYSQGASAGRYVFTAGQIGLDPATGEFVEGGAYEQTVRALGNPPLFTEPQYADLAAKTVAAETGAG